MIVKVSQSEKKVSAWINMVFENTLDVVDFHNNKYRILNDFINKNNLLPPQSNVERKIPLVFEDYNEYNSSKVTVSLPIEGKIIKEEKTFPFSVEILSSDFRQIR